MIKIPDINLILTIIASLFGMGFILKALDLYYRDRRNKEMQEKKKEELKTQARMDENNNIVANSNLDDLVREQIERRHKKQQ